MKQFLSLFRQFVFWMLFFTFQRALFLSYYFEKIKTEQVSVSEILSAFYFALRLDVSTASYVLIVPFVLLLIQSFGKMRWISKINKGYTFLVLVIFCLVCISELGLYKEWHTKLTYKALLYLKQPDEVIRSVPDQDIFLFVLLLLIQLVLFYWLYKKYFYREPAYYLKEKIPGKILFVVLIPGFLLLGIRGGYGEIPITVSQSYFSKHDILNVASVNSGYNIVFNIIDYYQIEESNIFSFMPDEEARDIVKQLHFVEKDTTIKIFECEQPNIVVILLESWSGDVIESLGGMAGITPQFHQLEKEGLLYTEFYATGNRSQQALASIYSGLPALPITTLTDHPGKYDALPSLIHILKKEGYFTSFYFGGDLHYGNIKSYLIHNQFDLLVEESNFESTSARGKLGVHDEGLFFKMLDELGNQPQPFFTTALTLSSHSPYDQPGKRPIDWIELENKYVNSIWYTDQWLGIFFEKVKEKPWYANTLFVVLSDHSHPSYNNYQRWSFKYRHIPLLILGGALDQQYEGKKSNDLFSNIDLPATILKQIDIEDTAFLWSKNMFNPYSPRLAFFETNEGFGWKRSGQYLEYKITVPLVLGSNVSPQKIDSFRKEGEAYLQVLFSDFLSY